MKMGFHVIFSRKSLEVLHIVKILYMYKNITVLKFMAVVSVHLEGAMCCL